MYKLLWNYVCFPNLRWKNANLDLCGHRESRYTSLFLATVNTHYNKVLGKFNDLFALSVQCSIKLYLVAIIEIRVQRDNIE